jgi:hypothetical protein
MAIGLLAFAFHTVRNYLDHLWSAARQAKRARRRFFGYIRPIIAGFPTGKP